MYLKKTIPKRVVIQGGVSQKAAYAWVNYLNEVLTMDRAFLSELIQTRVKCGAAIAMHPTLQVINLNQLDEMLHVASVVDPEPKPMLPPKGTDPLGRDWASPYPTIPNASPVKDLEDLPSPRWVAGVLGLINGFIGISEHGKGPIDAIVDVETKQILEFVVSDPYKKRHD